MTATGAVAGTYDFMPREQLTEFKYAKPTSDLWSIAATFYNLLTGQLPREHAGERDPVEVVLQDEAVGIREREPRIPSGLADVIDRALAIDPADRYASAAEMRAAIEQAL
jgi:serine/threonine-protein kinase